MSSAKAVTKELLASQKFLAGLHSFPSYGDTEGKQAMVLLQVIDNLSSDQAAGILQLLDKQIWSEPNRTGSRMHIGIQDDCLRT